MLRQGEGSRAYVGSSPVVIIAPGGFGWALGGVLMQRQHQLLAGCVRTCDTILVGNTSVFVFILNCSNYLHA